MSNGLASSGPPEIAEADRCIGVRLRTAGTKEYRVALRPQTLGASTVEEAAQLLQAGLRAGGPLILNLLDGSELRVPSSTITEMSVRRCGER